MAQFRFGSAHWLAPTIMVFALLAGILLALSHHLFYASLNRKFVPTGFYPFAGKNLPKQQFNASVGIALAFLVRTFVAVVVSTAYVQIFWRSTMNAKQYPTFAELDWANAGLANVFSLFNLKLGWKYPFLVLLAVIFWCIPIATIFPPATLSVQNSHRVLASMHQVPQFDFTTFNFVAALKFYGEKGGWGWTGPSQPLQHIALAVMGLGQILPINPPAPNASWTLDFWGPALQCNDVAATERDRIWTNIWNYYNDTSTDTHAFLSWVPRSYPDSQDLFIDRDLPFVFKVSDVSDAGGPPDSSVSTDGPASLFIAVLPETQVFMFTTQDLSTSARNFSYKGWECPFQIIQKLTDPICDDGNTTFAPALVYKDSTLLRCDLVNTSYSVEFSYSSGAQDIRISPNMTGNSPIVHASNTFLGHNSPGWSDLSEQANCSSFRANSYDSRYTPCLFDIDAVRLLSYQGIIAAFNQFVLGDIQNLGDSVNMNTTIMKTILAETKELAFIRDWNPSYGSYSDLQVLLPSGAGWAYPGLENSKLPDTRGDLKSTLEQLFQNFTISLLAEPYFQPNYSSPFAPSKLANDSLETYQNVYSYDRATLLIAYGLSILFTTLAVIAGMITLVQSGASFSDSFSTIIRVGRTADLSVEVLNHDGFGADPLPTYLKHARLDMGAMSTTIATNAHEMEEIPAEEQSLVVGPKDPPHRSSTVRTV